MNDENKIQDITNQLGSLTINELSQLCTELNAKWDIDASQFSSQNNISEAKVDSSDENVSYQVVLKDIGTDKIGLYKYLSPILGCSLLQTKNHLEKMPFIIKDELSKEEAEKISNDIKAALSTVVVSVEKN